MNTKEEMKTVMGLAKPIWDKLTKVERQLYEDRLYALASQVQFNAFNSAIALREIRDLELYKAAGWDTFEAFVDAELPFMKPDQAKNYCLILDTYGEKNKVRELIGKKGGFQMLLEAAKTISQKPEELTDERIEEIVTSRTRELEAEKRKLKEARDAKDELLKQRDIQIKDLEASLKIQEEEYDKVLKLKTSDDGIDWDLVKRLSSKKDIREHISQSMIRINEEIAWLSEVPDNIRDNEISGIVNSYLSLLEISMDTIRSSWFAQLSELPEHSAKNSGALNESEEQFVP